MVVRLMARAKKNSGHEGSDVTVGASRKHEAIGLLCVLSAIGLSFALMSFEPGTRGGHANLVGPVGHGVARGVLTALGVIGYVGAVLSVAALGLVLVLRGRWPRAISMISGASFLVALVVLAHLATGGASWLGQPAGGLGGGVVAELLREVIGRGGAALAAIGVLLLSCVGLFDMSLGTVAREGVGLLQGLYARGLTAFDTWREARAAERERVDELESAHREKAQSAEAKRLEKAEKLRLDLEEKKRLAVLKAQSKAEEKVLAKRAAEEAKARLEAEERVRQAEEDEAAEEGDEPALEIPPIADSEPPVLPSDAPHFDTDVEPAAEAPDTTPPSAPLPWAVEDEAPAFADTFVRTDAPAPAAPVAVVAPALVAAPPLAKPVDPTALLGPEIIPARRDEPSDALLDDEAEDAEDNRPPVGIFRAPAAGAVALRARVEKKHYELPPLKLLDYKAPPPVEIDGEDLRGRATRLEEKLRTYGVDGRVTAIRPGPVVTTYEYLPAPGVKVSKIAGLSDDIAMAMTARSVRIIAPIPGKGVVGIELPNENRESVFLKELIAHDRFHKSKSLLTLALGKDTEGETQVRDLQKMPHVLIAGTTGSGKSVSVNAMILSILYKATPDQVKFIMVDPKMLELSLYNDIPHLLLPVVTDAKKASLALQWAVDEMERRYKLLSEFKVRNIEGFNKKLELLRDQRGRLLPPPPPPGDDALEPEALLADDADAASSAPPTPSGEDLVQDPWPSDRDLPEDLPYIVVLVDEFADLMCVAPRDVEMSVQRLAQKARAAGIHLMLATQRPSTDVITGVIKNNFPSRLSFRVASRHDSATIINQPGAESLLGMGDMLALGGTSSEPQRVHGAFVSEEEVQRVVEFWKAQGKPVYDQAILKPREDEDGEGGEDLESEKDEMYDQAVRIVTETRKASISALQRRLRVGYNRAARMIELMEKEGIVSAALGAKGDREVLVQAMGADGPARA
jgi:S-DNA-T family DNA segregation ATPase FtsK/SpoIIIE